MFDNSSEPWKIMRCNTQQCGKKPGHSSYHIFGKDGQVRIQTLINNQKRFLNISQKRNDLNNISTRLYLFNDIAISSKPILGCLKTLKTTPRC